LFVVEQHGSPQQIVGKILRVRIQDDVERPVLRIGRNHGRDLQRDAAVLAGLRGEFARCNGVALLISLKDKGDLFALLDKYEDALSSYERALNLQDNPLSVDDEAELLNKLTDTHLSLARHMDQEKQASAELAGKALECAHTAVNLAGSEDNQRFLAWSLVNLGSAYSLAGKYIEAEEAFKKAMALSETPMRIQVDLLVNYAWMLCDVKRFSEADVMLTQAYDKTQSSNLDGAMDRIFEARTRLEMLSGKTAEAMLWSERRFKFTENQYRRRLASIARNAEIYIDIERTRLADRRNKIQTGALSAIKASGWQANGIGQDQGLKDSLTGCLNRLGFTAHSASMLAPGGRAALAIVDADNFRSINDHYGHEIGDRVLKTISKIFTDSLRGSDLVARYDGEEFALLLHGIGSEIAWGICERLRLAVANHGWGNVNPGLHVTVSIGIAARANDETLDILTTTANTAVSRAKAEGRNRVIAGN
jgi:diguanylate cyclase (GGDEF)-like protein